MDQATAEKLLKHNRECGSYTFTQIPEHEMGHPDPHQMTYVCKKCGKKFTAVLREIKKTA